MGRLFEDVKPRTKMPGQFQIGDRVRCNCVGFWAHGGIGTIIGKVVSQMHRVKLDIPRMMGQEWTAGSVTHMEHVED